MQFMLNLGQKPVKMASSKLIKLLNYNGSKALMSTTSKSVVLENDYGIDLKKLEHYRHLNELENTDANPSGWDDAKPFKSVPGPKAWPIVGNFWRFLLPFGNFYRMDFLEIHRRLYKQYGDICILNGLLGRNPVVTLFNVDDIEMLYRNEGVWPIREGLVSFKHYRDSRRDIFKNPGILTHQGEEWFKFRSVVNPILMQPRNVLQYVEQMNFVANELVDNIKYFSEQNTNGEMPEDFNNELYKWSLESIGVVTMDRHLGCLNRNSPKDSEAQKLIANVLEMFNLMYKLDVLPSMWTVFPTRTWRRYVKVLDFLSNTNMKYVNQYLDKLEQGVETDKTNVLQKLVKVERDVAVAMAVDMMIAGVDTTGRILAAALYYLSKNTNSQEQLRKEITELLETKDTPITKEVLSKVPYLKAVIKETLRLSPIAIGNQRKTQKNLVLGGYQIPKGTDVVTSNLMLCHEEKYFPRAKEFLPERWLPTTSGDLSHKNTNPFLFAPFGYGPRSCIGKRLANLEVEVAVLKIIRNFELKWPHEDMVFSTGTLHGVARPLKIHVKPLDH